MLSLERCFWVFSSFFLAIWAGVLLSHWNGNKVHISFAMKTSVWLTADISGHRRWSRSKTIIDALLMIWTADSDRGSVHAIQRRVSMGSLYSSSLPNCAIICLLFQKRDLESMFRVRSKSPEAVHIIDTRAYQLWPGPRLKTSKMPGCLIWFDAFGAITLKTVACCFHPLQKPSSAQYFNLTTF